ncbi:hypothetical protein B0H34DRAFT_672696 [Crassisporium funariophilum]|nr:hypothetical protein B0H34DRAFT_672696 [Crassisporium funariophilum]
MSRMIQRVGNSEQSSHGIGRSPAAAPTAIDAQSWSFAVSQGHSMEGMGVAIETISEIKGQPFDPRNLAIIIRSGGAPEFHHMTPTRGGLVALQQREHRKRVVRTGWLDKWGMGLRDVPAPQNFPVPGAAAGYLIEVQNYEKNQEPSCSRMRKKR